MTALLNIWREFSSYLRYANSRNLALLTINASILALASTWLTPPGVPYLIWQIFKPPLGYHTIIISLITGSQLILFISFIPSLDSERAGRSRWISIARSLHLITPAVPSDRRNPFFFGEVSQFNDPKAYFEYLKMHYSELVGDVSADHSTSFACIQQIWIISGLTTKKFAQFALSLSLLWAAGILYLSFAFASLGSLICRLN
jgi:hypothetical protein